MKQLELSLIVVLLAVSSAIAQDVRYNFADAQFTKFRTYKWVTIKDAQKVDEQTNKQITNSLDMELTKKHLTRTDADTADLYIGYQVGEDTGRPLALYNPNWRYGPGWSQEGFFGGIYGKDMLPTSTIYAGQLALDMYDPNLEYLVWRGVVSKTFEPMAAPDIQQRILHKAVAHLFKKYPPPVLDSLSY